MNYPAASCGVSEKTELLPMYPRILKALLFDVPLNAFFIAMLPHRTHEVPVAPKLSAPKLLLYFRTLPKYFPRCYALDYLHDLFRTIHRHRLYQKMNMILVRPDLYKRHFVPLANLQTHLFQTLVYRRRKHHSAVFCRTNYVVQQYRYIMALVYISTHTSHYSAASCGESTPRD
jgi:hypothetical protein